MEELEPLWRTPKAAAARGYACVSDTQSSPVVFSRLCIWQTCYQRVWMQFTASQSPPLPLLSLSRISSCWPWVASCMLVLSVSNSVLPPSLPKQSQAAFAW